MRAGLPDRRALRKVADGRGGKTRVIQEFDKVVDTLCPFCGVGCQTSVAVKDNRIVQVDGRNGYANENRLCVKGRFGFDYAMSPDRLTKPLIRRDDAPKSGDADMRGVDPLTVFREATWEEALERAAGGLKTILRRSTAARRWPASVRPRAPTRKPICSRSWCARDLAPTTSTIARGFATHPRWRRSWKA